MARPALRTQKSAIAEYWLGTPEGRARLPGNAALIDFGEPSCFACGWMAADPDAEPILWRVWEDALLERCHLVPHALGGLDSPYNLVLLCGRCHRDAPDVRNAGYMLAWICDRESWGSALCQALERALQHAAVTEAQIVRFNNCVRQNASEFERSLAKLLQEFAVPVGRSFSTATLAACSVELVRHWTGEPST
jgi:HNH endonuclease